MADSNDLPKVGKMQGKMIGRWGAKRGDTIVVPAWSGLEHTAPDDSVLAALRRAHARGARLMTVCSGAFVLAHAGLLDRVRQTTH